MSEKNLDTRKVKLPEPIGKPDELTDADLESVAGGCTVSCGSTCTGSCGKTS